MQLRTLAVAGTAMLALAGCTGGGGGSNGQPTPSSGGGDNSRQLLLQAASCIRSHGFPDWPDPIRDDHDRWRFPDSAPNVTLPAECDALIRSAKGGGVDPSQRPKTAEEMTQLRKWAECMRSHGVPSWPDPDSDGAFLPPAELQPLDTNDAFNAADDACRSLRPSDIRLNQRRQR